MAPGDCALVISFETFNSFEVAFVSISSCKRYRRTPCPWQCWSLALFWSWPRDLNLGYALGVEVSPRALNLDCLFSWNVIQTLWRVVIAVALGRKNLCHLLTYLVTEATTLGTNDPSFIRQTEHYRERVDCVHCLKESFVQQHQRQYIVWIFSQSGLLMRPDRARIDDALLKMLETFIMFLFQNL